VLLAPPEGKRHLQPADTFPGLYIHQKIRLRPSSRSSRKRIFCVFRAQGTCLLAADFVVSVLNELYKLKQICLFLNLLYATV